MRIPKGRRRGPCRLFGTAAGWFNDRAAFVREVSRVTGRDAEAVYITLNPVAPELLEALREQKPRLLRFLQRPAPAADDGRCTVHGRYLTFAEARSGACSWCEADPIELASWRGNRRARRGEGGHDVA